MHKIDPWALGQCYKLYFLLFLLILGAKLAFFLKANIIIQFLEN
jgi:hypothetical protein